MKNPLVLVGVAVVVAVGGGLYVMKSGSKIVPLNDVRAQLKDVDPSQVVYIESKKADGTPGFSSDTETIKACVNAVLHAKSKGKNDHKADVPLNFYLKPDASGAKVRRPVMIGERANLTEDFGKAMKDCTDSFDKTAKADEPK